MQAGSTPDVKDNFGDLATPNPADMQIQLEQLVQQGSLSPEQAQAIMADPSKMEQITTDPRFQQAQMSALDELSDITSNGGLTAIDKSKLNDISNQEATQQRGAREAIIQNAQARGMGGSGIEMAQQMQNQQDSATRQNSKDLDVAAMAQQRALDALAMQGQMGSNMQNQQFNQKAQVAGAQDAVSKFNAANQQAVGLANTQANNQAQAANLGVKQGTADANTQMRNAQQQYNKNLIQGNFDNELKKRGGSAQAQQFNAQAQGQNSQNQANATNQTIGMGMSAAAMFSDERGKEDIEEFNASDFLDSLTPHKYKYKDQKHGEGQQAGVMAQDLEKTEIGSKLVTDTPEGKMVDYGKAGPTMMASIAELNQRLKKMENGEE